MRLSRIIMALTVGLAVAAVPTAAGAAQPDPTQPPPVPSPTLTVPGDPTQPPSYPPRLAALTLSRSTIVVGEAVTLTGDRWQPNERVDIDISTAPLAAGPVGGARRGDGTTVAMVPVAQQRPAQAAPLPNLRGTADVNGHFEVDHTPKRAGKYTYTAVGRQSRLSATAVLTVLSDQSQSQPPLPVTGSSLSTPLKVGGGLVGAGAVLLLLTLAWRRRNSFGAGAAR